MVSLSIFIDVNARYEARRRVSISLHPPISVMLDAYSEHKLCKWMAQFVAGPMRCAIHVSSWDTHEETRNTATCSRNYKRERWYQCSRARHRIDNLLCVVMIPGFPVQSITWHRVRPSMSSRAALIGETKDTFFWHTLKRKRWASN